MSNLSDALLDCTVDSVLQPRPPSEGLAAFYSIAQGLLPGLNLPYDVSSTLRNSSAASSPNFDINLPGGVTIPSLDNKEATDILGWLSPLMGAISAGLMVLGPVKIIIDVIIAIINVLCSFPDPFKMASALSALFLALIPLLGLFPITAGLLLLFETAKTVILILAAILSQLLPKMELIIENVKMIGPALQGNNSEAVSSISAKICLVSQTMLDELAILAPINKILALISAFLGLGSAGICSPGSDCCDDCPEIVRNPPIGSAEIISRAGESTDVRLRTARFNKNYLGAPSVGSASIGAAMPVGRAVDGFFILLFGTSVPSDTEPLGSKLIDLSHYKESFKCLFTFETPIVATRAERTSNVFKFFSRNHQLNKGDVVSVSGESSVADIFRGDYKVVDVDSTAFYVNSKGADMAPMNTASLNIRKHYTCTAVSFDGDNVKLTVSNILPEQVITEYEIVFNESSLTKNQQLTLGCMSESALARGEFERTRDNDLQAALVNNTEIPAQLSFGSSAETMLGIPVPTIDEDGIRQAIIDFANNPLDGGIDVLFNKINLEIDTFKNLASRSLCVLVSGLNSTLDTDLTVVDFTSASPYATIKYQPRSKDNKPLLVGIPSNIDINAVFSASSGTLSDVAFDINTGTYSATLTHNAINTVVVKAFFVTTDVCSTPQTDSSTQKQITVQFVDGSQRLKRDNRTYIQSAGGRRR